MELTKVFIRNLKDWRKSAGISQEKLAERCNSAHSYIRQIECGSRYPSFSFIEKIAGALNIAPYLLFYDETRQSGSGEQMEKIQRIKAELLEAVSCDIQTAFGKLQKPSVPEEVCQTRKQ